MAALTLALSACGSAERAPPTMEVPGLAGLNGRRGELLNPDTNTMVLLYYDLAGIAPPFDEWVERDMRVRTAPAIDKAASRAVRDVGLIRLSMNANLSDCDPANAEFTVGALAPSSYLSFEAFGEKIALSFANGRTAQIWSVPADRAQAIRDRIDVTRNVTIDALLRITAVQPRPGGGAVMASVVEYDLRSGASGPAIAHLQITGH